MVSERLRTRLAESGRFSITDIAPVAKEARASNLQSCGGCDVSLAAKVGADLAITGMVRKISNLILGMTIFVRDARSGDTVAVAHAVHARRYRRILESRGRLAGAQPAARVRDFGAPR